MRPVNVRLGIRVTTVAFALIGLASIGGCSSDNDSDDFLPPTVPPITPTPVVDAFFTVVSGLAANSPEDSEPGAIETAVVTAAEDSEPEPLS